MTISIKYTKALINGEWKDGSSRKTSKLINPATEDILCEVTECSENDLNDAALSAASAFSSKSWTQIGGGGRAKLLWKLADLIERDADEIATLETINQGKPIFESRKIDIPFVVNLFRYFAGWADKLEGETVPVVSGFLNFTLREPVGVVGLIIPWNFPLLLTCWKLAPALASGCTVIIKPSELTPLSALKLGALCIEAGFPSGVVNIVTGKGSEVGHAMTINKHIRKIAFTGSTQVGREVMKNASSTIKRVSLELGGKSPNIVFTDAQLEKAAQGVCSGIFYNKGEVCAAGSRLFVQKEIYNTFVDLVVSKMSRYVPGDPLNEKTRLGPQVSSAHRDSIMKKIEIGKSEGAQIVVGGISTSVNGKGYYVEPTIFQNVKNSMSIAQEEIFGPVLAVIPFETEEEVISLANGSCYGLASGVWTQDPAKALRIATSLQAGTVWVNTYNMFHPASPFGGYKESGFGRELGKEALSAYLETKSVWISVS